MDRSATASSSLRTTGNLQDVSVLHVLCAEDLLVQIHGGSSEAPLVKHSEELCRNPEEDL